MAKPLRPILRFFSQPSVFQLIKPNPFLCQSCRHARLLKRPKRTYTFTQLVTLSDGSAFTMRTTSPLPVYRSSRDSRNSILWNPSSKELFNVEDDEAGRLAGFRARFGRSFDSSKENANPAASGNRLHESSRSEAESGTGDPLESTEQHDADDESLLDLISSFGQPEKPHGPTKKMRK